MKIKIFADTNTKRLEELVNDFISSGKEVIDIKYFSISLPPATSTSRQFRMNDRILIMYEESKKRFSHPPVTAEDILYEYEHGREEHIE